MHIHQLFQLDLIDTLWNVKREGIQGRNGYTADLIDTLWNVKTLTSSYVDGSTADLIDTLWNVKLFYNVKPLDRIVI